MREFLKKKDIEISFKRYGQEALTFMALGLFSSLLIGLILKTVGNQLLSLDYMKAVGEIFVEVGGTAMGLMGSAIGVAIAVALKAPPLVLFASVVTGMMGANMTSESFMVQGGPAGAFITVIVATEIGKAISKETKIDVILTPFLTIISGAIVAKIFSPIIGFSVKMLGNMVMKFTELQPFFMGFLVAIVIGLALTAPISSAALCIMLDLSGIAGGAALAGCCAQMVGFAVMTYKENGFSGLVAQGIGTSMIQIPNILKNWWLLIPPTIASGVCGVLSTTVFKMNNGALFSGMGTSGFVGQIGALTVDGFTKMNVIAILTVHFIVPTIIVLFFRKILERRGKISFGDGALEL